jgi:hypothetical protein
MDAARFFATITRMPSGALRPLLPLALFAAAALPVRAEEARGIENPLHGYWTRAAQDRFSRLKAEIESGRAALDGTSERAMLESVLRLLEVPASSQTLVFTATSLQKGLINARNPRALYFNDDTYVGYVPGGRLEILSLDPELGGIFYILDRARGERPPRAQRERNCMNCHSPHYLGEIPALLLESVVPVMSGGGEKAFRREQTGHGVPLGERFGGWYVTGDAGFARHWGNLIYEYGAQGRRERPLAPGELFDWARYPVATSDVLAHLVHEHQVGFVNRVTVGTYRTRELLAGEGSAEAVALEIEKLARAIVRYALFADEVPLPAAIAGDAAFKAAFLSTRKPAANGAALKDFDLRTRLFKLRCSYKVYSPSFTGMPPELKTRVHRLLARALDGAEPEFTYLPAAERAAIRTILVETLPDFAAAAGKGKTSRAQ